MYLSAFFAHLVGFVILFGFGRFRVRWALFWFLSFFLFCLFCLFCFVLCFLVFVLYFMFVWCFFWKVLGELRPGGPPHLTLNLPGFSVLLFLFVFLGGVVLEGLGSGEVGPPHLTLYLPRFFVLVFLLLFCLFCLSCFVVLFLWVRLCLLFSFLFVNKKALFSFKTCFPILFWILFFVVLFSLLFLKLACFCVVFLSKETK